MCKLSVANLLVLLISQPLSFNAFIVIMLRNIKMLLRESISKLAESDYSEEAYALDCNKRTWTC